ncbi:MULTISPECIES: acyltransferase family protein [unclassified Pseudoalteromonas]|uniref:acyltransferase family protein n=1 Tax=unclassified Pseudoalteromonas TaxID=194690 RepID=UPI0025B5706C|nr:MULTISPECIES: acyltransferase family protein [unclassified Pseudoalteromonas]MDN3380645.1 acyltransferase family protein [Pseudoalteromonas sp. APC 3893]MDN3389032.1 acyltransferase family protein [Pseudoalteromonas sp. APC 4017]
MKLKIIIKNTTCTLLKPWLNVFNQVEELPSRRYDLDWLRVLAFGLLIFYHAGMLYSKNWGFHFKSQYLSSSIENIMLLLSPWRMGLIWFISGVALRFIVARFNLGMFLITRSVKILLPLLFGIWFIVPIQLYAQMSLEVGLSMSFWQFYQQFFDLTNPLFEHYQAGIWPHVDVNHLWYLRSLWQFTLLLVLVLPLILHSHVRAVITRLCGRSLFTVFIVLLLPLCILKLSWPSDTFRYPMGALFLLYGYLLAWQPAFYSKLLRHWQALFAVFVLGYLVVLLGYHMIWQNPAASQWQITSMDMLYTAQRLVGVFLILALAQRFLDHDHPKLALFNSAVFPFYLLHQSVIIGLAFYLSKLQLGGFVEPLLILSLAFIICWLVFIAARRIDLLSPLLGIKVTGKYKAWQIKAGFGCGLILVSPLLFRLI